MNNECKKTNIYIEYLKWYVKKYTSKSIMFACISLNPGLLMNNECKKINIYIEYLKWYVKKCTSKSIIFTCILLNLMILWIISVKRSIFSLNT